MTDLKLNPALIAGAAFALLISLAALFVYLRDDDSPTLVAADEATVAGETQTPCSGSDDIVARGTVSGTTFEVVGEFVSASEGFARVRTPDGTLDLVNAANADVKGQFLAGDWIAATGNVDRGRMMATEFRQPCSDTLVGPAPITPEPSPSTSPTRTRGAAPPPTPAAPPPTEAPPPPTAAPTPSPEPVPPGATWPTPTATVVDEGEDGGD
jgi:hypothetical protein